MATHPTLNELTRRGVAALRREIGVVGTIRFLNQLTEQEGDYTAERKAMLGEVGSVEELLEEARRIDRSGERARNQYRT